MSSPNAGFGAARMLDDELVQMLARHWEDGWNHGDLETIMAPFATDVVFSSPGISMMTGDPAKTTIEGAAGLREYLDAALRRSGTSATRCTSRTPAPTASFWSTRAASLTERGRQGPTSCASTGTTRWSSGDATTDAMCRVPV